MRSLGKEAIRFFAGGYERSGERSNQMYCWRIWGLWGKKQSDVLLEDIRSLGKEAIRCIAEGNEVSGERSNQMYCWRIWCLWGKKQSDVLLENMRSLGKEAIRCIAGGYQVSGDNQWHLTWIVVFYIIFVLHFSYMQQVSNPSKIVDTLSSQCSCVSEHSHVDNCLLTAGSVCCRIAGIDPKEVCVASSCSQYLHYSWHCW